MFKHTVHVSPDSEDGGFLVTTTIENSDKSPKKRWHNYAKPNGNNVINIIASHIVGNLASKAYEHDPKKADSVLRIWYKNPEDETIYYTILSSYNKIPPNAFENIGLTLIEIETQSHFIYFLFGIIPYQAAFDSHSMINWTPYIKNDEDYDSAIENNSPLSCPELLDEHIAMVVLKNLYDVSIKLRARKLIDETGRLAPIEHQLIFRNNSHFYWNSPSHEYLSNITRKLHRYADKWPPQFHRSDDLQQLFDLPNLQHVPKFIM